MFGKSPSTLCDKELLYNMKNTGNFIRVAYIQFRNCFNEGNISKHFVSFKCASIFVLCLK